MRRRYEDFKVGDLYRSELARTVTETDNLLFTMLAMNTNELHFNEDIVRASRSADVHNVANDLPINALLPLLERAQSMISVDTGPAHAAAALGCPTVALFGKQDPTLFRPGGATTPAVTLTGLVDGVQNILGITPENVIAAWGDLIRSTQNRAEQSVNSLTCD